MIRGALLAGAMLCAAAAVGATLPAVPVGGVPATVRVDDAVITGAGFPATLAAYGFFADAPAQRPAAGVTPYRLNTPLWSDGAEKLRFLYLPAGASARAAGEGLLDLPVGAALIKTFAFPVAGAGVGGGSGGARRLIETRVLLHRADGWVALPYVWNAAQTEARLALGGSRVPVTTPAGQAISYAVPNKNQCKECHAIAGVLTPIGPKARNLAPQWLAEQLRAGRLDKLPAVAAALPLWEARSSAPITAVARAYLDVNCAHCHNPQGSASNTALDLRWQQNDPIHLGIAKRPVAAGRGAGTFEFDVVPGDPDHSILAYRMQSTEGGVAMPELGKTTVDPAGVAAVRSWITALRGAK